MRRTALTFFALILATLTQIASVPAMPAAAPTTKTALFAGGCFWCMQSAFSHIPGIIETKAGYKGGTADTAHYETVSGGQTGHREAVQVIYDPNKVAYTRLLELYWENVDPTDAEGQFADHGNQYKAAIFYADAGQQAAAIASKQVLAKKFAPQPITVDILPAKPFYAAEEHHQNYAEKNPAHYMAYEYGSGRSRRLKQLWGETKPAK